MKNNITAFVLAVAFVIVALILGNAYKYKFRTTDTISVTGMAEKDFTSDLIVWNGTYSHSNYDLKIAYKLLKDDERAIKSYIESKGIAAAEIVFSAVDINKNYANKTDSDGRVISSEFTGYTLSQSVKIESKNVEKIEALSREVTELIESGIELSSAEPAYYYTKLSELKISLLAEAGKDAKERAETISNNAGSKIGSLKKATMGVFQITGKNSDEDYSYGGAFNTSSKLKTATITLKTEYNTQ